MADFSLLGSSESKMETFGQTASSIGTEIAPSGTANTKGAWVEMITSTSFNYESITVYARKRDATNHILDVGIGSVGNEEVVASNIPFNAHRATEISTRHIDLPLSIPAGTRVSFRCQSSAGDASTELNCMISGYSGSFISTQGISKVVDYGVSTSTSLATTVTSGTADTKGSFIELEAATSEDLKSFIVSVGCAGAAPASNLSTRIDIAIGGSGSEVVIASDLWTYNNSSGPQITDAYFYVPIQIPKGSRITSRIMANISSSVRSIGILGAV